METFKYLLKFLVMALIWPITIIGACTKIFDMASDLEQLKLDVESVRRDVSSLKNTQLRP